MCCCCCCCCWQWLLGYIFVAYLAALNISTRPFLLPMLAVARGKQRLRLRLRALFHNRQRERESETERESERKTATRRVGERAGCCQLSPGSCALAHDAGAQRSGVCAAASLPTLAAQKCLPCAQPQNGCVCVWLLFCCRFIFWPLMPQKVGMLYCTLHTHTLSRTHMHCAIKQH